MSNKQRKTISVPSKTEAAAILIGIMTIATIRLRGSPASGNAYSQPSSECTTAMTAAITAANIARAIISGSTLTTLLTTITITSMK